MGRLCHAPGMRRTLALTTAAALLTLAGCSSTGTTAAPAATNGGPIATTAAAAPATSAATSFTVPDLTGQTLDTAQNLATGANFNSTPEDSSGKPLDITALEEWTVCTQTPKAGTATDSNSVILVVAHTAAGQQCAGSKAAPTKAAGPKVLLKVKGNGIKNTAKFTTGDSWTIHYTYDCTKTFGGDGNFTVYVDYPTGDIPVNELGKKGSDSSTASGAGTHTLKVASECDWTLTVTDG